MAIPEFVREFFRLEPETRAFWLNFGIDLGFFLLALLLSLLVGHLTPPLVRWLVWRFAPQRAAGIYANLIAPIKNLFWIAGTLILISLSLQIVQPYEALYGFLGFFFDLALIAGIAWLLSRLFRQFVRAYGIDLIRRLGREVNELLLIVETVANVMIGFFAVVAFAQSQNFNLVGLLAGVGIGGLAIAFAAQRTLEQLLGTIVLYLDRPFVPGDYIRANFNPAAPDLYGRIESIGLRSTKIRTAAKSTLYIVPNSTMANLDIENITRGKKVMVLLYLDFTQILGERERALVEQVVEDSTNALFGIDPGSTRVSLFETDSKPGTRARQLFHSGIERRFHRAAQALARASQRHDLEKTGRLRDRIQQHRAHRVCGFARDDLAGSGAHGQHALDGLERCLAGPFV